MSNENPIGPLEANYCFTAYKLNRSFMRFYQTMFSETGLTYPKYVILNVLAESGPLTVSQLSDRAGVENNTLSPLLKRMANFGAIARERDPNDERRVVITLTDLGRTGLAAAREVVAQGFSQLDLDPAEVTQTLTYMNRVQAKLDGANPPKLTEAAMLGQKD